MAKMLLDYYKAIENSSSLMLQAAMAEDWDTVVRCEGACAVLIEQLRLKGREEDLDLPARKEKTRIMLRIIHNDAQIRVLAEPWLGELEQKFEGQFNLH